MAEDARTLTDVISTLRVGLWNGAVTTANGRLLYRQLLADAHSHGVDGGTVWRGIEGGHARGAFRSIESEVASNELPLWIDLVAARAALLAWLPRAGKMVREHGVITMEPVDPDREQSPGEQPQEGGARWGRRVDIYTLERRKRGGRPLYQAIGEFARRRGLLWLSTTRGLCGLGDSGRLHEPGWWMKRDDVPIIVTILDTTDKLDPCLAELVELVANQGVVVSSVVHWHHP
jgi:PII-like signaling protein